MKLRLHQVVGQSIGWVSAERVGSEIVEIDRKKTNISIQCASQRALQPQSLCLTLIIIQFKKFSLSLDLFTVFMQP